MKRLITAGLATAAIAESLMGAGAADADVYYKNCTAASGRRSRAPLHEVIPATRLSTVTATASPEEYASR